MNLMLESVEAMLTAGFEKPKKPVVFVVGAPRSGTTLLAQMLATTNAFGYVNNFVARFWYAPYVGQLLANSLGYGWWKSNFKSRYGVTEGAREIHEFGHFWRRFLFGNEVERPRLLNQEIAALESLHSKPMLFKNLLVVTVMEEIYDTFPEVLFVSVARSPYYNLWSLYQSRLRYGADKWFSLKPRAYTDEWLEWPIEKQIGRQLAEIERDVFGARVPRLSVTYSDLCRNPREIVVRIGSIADTTVTDHALKRIPDSFRCQNQQLPPREAERMVEWYYDESC
jgi:hypothetical protein